MKILITGANGQLGRDCMSALRSSHELTGVDLPDFDISDRDKVRVFVRALRPDVIVNCAAYTRVDDCEKEQDLCHKVNAQGPWVLAESAHEAQALLVHVSTDYVFDGRRPPPEPYVETDPTGPLSWYGRTKLAGEDAVNELAGRSIIVRTAWLYGRYGHNFMKAILRKALKESHRALRVVNDQYGSPTWSWRLALQIQRLIETGHEGLYHATAEGYCTWFDFAQEALRLLQVPVTVQPCRTAEYPTPACRPVNSILENARLKKEGLNVFRDWRTDLEEFVARHGPEVLKEVQAST